ncbi:MAG: cytochrome c [Shewanella sp.]|nr:cytochrome c [Shewanella sp.]MCF1429678.1 cytochrome c [Shewanella sp.]MCF1437430.1 cytochrome c [Shewanella sp.]MCF1456312.1 cytochrome c [Shewanella sp.]
MKLKLSACLLASLLLSSAAQAMEHDQFNQALDKLNADIPVGILSHQADVGKGQKLAQNRCIACHGEGMLKVMKLYPSLNGQKAAYLVKQLVEFKAGKRVNSIMHAQAMGLTEADIKDVALYYSQQPLKPLN